MVSIKYAYDKLLHYRVKLLKLYCLFCVCILIISCNKSSEVQYQIHLPDHDYSFTTDTNIFKFVLDTNKVYIGDPILFSFINKIKRERFDMYIGTKDPIRDWKFTFDFKETKNTLEQQLMLDTAKVFIRKQSIQYCDCSSKLVLYSFDRRKIIESQFICLDDLRVNVVLAADMNAEDDNLISEFDAAIRSIKISDKPIR